MKSIFPYFLIKAKNFSENVAKVGILSLFLVFKSHGKIIMRKQLVKTEDYITYIRKGQFFDILALKR